MCVCIHIHFSSVSEKENPIRLILLILQHLPFRCALLERFTRTGK
eukprot:jgi/Antlo1/223/1505